MSIWGAIGKLAKRGYETVDRAHSALNERLADDMRRHEHHSTETLKSFYNEKRTLLTQVAIRRLLQDRGVTFAPDGRISDE